MVFQNCIRKGLVPIFIAHLIISTGNFFTLAELIGFEGPLAGDLKFFVRNPADGVAVSAPGNCKMTQVKACTGGKSEHLCSVILTFEDCDSIAAKTSKCDPTSKFYKNDGKCTETGPIDGIVTKFEGFKDKKSTKGITTGFNLITNKSDVYKLGNTERSNAES